MKTAYLQFRGRQEGLNGRSFDLYNIERLSEPDIRLAVGSTVTLSTVWSAGYTVKISEEQKYDNACC